MKAREACPVCDSTSCFELDQRRNIPIAQNLVFRDRQSAINCPVGQLRMVRCRDCGFAWNALFDPALMKYDVTYDNDQNFSAVFRAHVDFIAERVVALQPDNQALRILEIGCGQGSFLAILAQHLGPRLAAAIGFDPAWRGDRGMLPRNAEVIGDYYTRETAGRIQADPHVVVSRHTIEHVPDPIPFLAAIRRVSKPGAMVLIETPTVDWILENGMFFDFFYEHCSIFNPHSIALALRRVGFEVQSVELVFGGQYLLAVGKVPDADALPDPAALASGAFSDLDYRHHREAYMERFRRTIMSAPKGAGLALWGGASKGVTLALILEEERDSIRCAIDINPRKQGGFLPGTGVPILGPEAAHAAGVRTALVLNPNYATEIGQYCRARSMDMALLTI